MHLFGHKFGLEEKLEINEKNVLDAIDSLENDKFVAYTVLRKMYDLHKVSPEYEEEHTNSDLLSLIQILDAFVEQNTLGRWDVYYVKKEKSSNNDTRYIKYGSAAATY